MRATPRQDKKIIIEKLGKCGLNRIRDFCTFYPYGWGENGQCGSGKKLNDFAFVYFICFLKLLPTPKKIFPKVHFFLDGSIGLLWKNKNNKVISIRFWEKEVGYYIQESKTKEHVTYNNNLEDIVKKLPLSEYY